MDQQLCLSFVGRSLSWGMECCLKNLREKKLVLKKNPLFHSMYGLQSGDGGGEEHAQEQGWSEHLVVADGQGRAVRFVNLPCFSSLQPRVSSWK